MTDEYRVGVAVSTGREIKSLAKLSKNEAETLHYLLMQPPGQRVYEAMKLGRLLIHTGKTKRIRVYTTVEGMPYEQRTLSWEAAHLYVAAVSARNEPGLIVMRDDLDRIRRGVAENGSLLKPFLPTEGFNKKVVD